MNTGVQKLNVRLLSPHLFEEPQDTAAHIYGELILSQTCSYLECLTQTSQHHREVVLLLTPAYSRAN